MNKIEIAHDILAKRIYDKVSSEDKMRHKIKALLQERMAYYEERQVLLNEEDLQYIEPFLANYPLSAHQKDFINKSKKSIYDRKQRTKKWIMAAAAFWVACNAIIWPSNYYASYSLVEDQENLAAIKQEETRKQAAEARADSLYKELIAVDSNFHTQILESFDTLLTVSGAIQEERDIAQSTTLSNLAQAALDQEDNDTAFKLAAKAWDLNPDNHLACDILYFIGADTTPSKLWQLPKEERNRFVEKIIEHEQYKNNRSLLSNAATKLIFEEHNKVVKKKEAGLGQKLDRATQATSPKETTE